MTLLRDFAVYLKAVFAESQRLVFTVFDIVGIVLFFFPYLAEGLVKDEGLARIIGGFIFFTAFLLANFTLYRRTMRNTSTLGEHSLQLYPHKNPPYNAVKILYVGTEIAKDLNVKVTYRDNAGNEQTKVITDFFPKEDPRMWQHYYRYDFLEPNQVAYFHLLQKKNTLDGKATVWVSFSGANSGKSVQVKKDFSLEQF